MIEHTEEALRGRTQPVLGNAVVAARHIASRRDKDVRATERVFKTDIGQIFHSPTLSHTPRNAICLGYREKINKKGRAQCFARDSPEPLLSVGTGLIIVIPGVKILIVAVQGRLVPVFAGGRLVKRSVTVTLPELPQRDDLRALRY